MVETIAMNNIVLAVADSNGDKAAPGEKEAWH